MERNEDQAQQAVQATMVAVTVLRQYEQIQSMMATLEMVRLMGGQR